MYNLSRCDQKMRSLTACSSRDSCSVGVGRSCSKYILASGCPADILGYSDPIIHSPIYINTALTPAGPIRPSAPVGPVGPVGPTLPGAPGVPIAKYSVSSPLTIHRPFGLIDGVTPSLPGAPVAPEATTPVQRPLINQ